MTGTVVLSGFNSAQKEIKKNYIIFSFLIVFLVFMLVGSSSICFSENSNFYGISDIFKNYYTFSKTCTFLNVFGYKIFIYLTLLFLCYIFSNCLFGFIIIYLIDIFIGFGAGFTAGYLYSAYSLNGICYYALIIVPGLFLFSVLIFICMKRSFVFSKFLFDVFTKNINFDYKAELKIHSIKFVFYFVSALAISVIESFITRSFIGYFNF